MDTPTNSIDGHAHLSSGSCPAAPAILKPLDKQSKLLPAAADGNGL